MTVLEHVQPGDWDNVRRNFERLRSSARDTTEDRKKIALPYGAGWADNAAGWEGGTYSRQGFVVYLQGAVTKTGGAPVANDTIATLPEGFRPADDLRFIVITTTATLGVVQITPAGVIQWDAGDAGETDITHLSGIQFVIA